MRRKVYTKDQILKAAYEVVEGEGFSGFTARNIAKKMGISTQPIYLEFKNMGDLKNTLLDEICNHLYYDVFPEVRTGDTIIDLGLNYVYFAKEQNNLYNALYVQEYGGGKKMHDFSYKYFRQLVSEHPKYSKLDENHINALHVGSWITVTGIATLMSSGIISPTQDEIVHLLNRAIENVLEKEDTSVLDSL
ncbi:MULTISPECIES: TetR/AcrR family transcriptional regulator [Enterococcus]|uniref:TetR/AcrR family transcriptional regulator n=1 Tax=Enterococcus alishanensis TaxID=1303817 RepID=A0ABS6THZ7_9ENTE|nr:TetR/AcrR family transcriptional regulator [Enterococcus alishanensis]MBV7392452.1 TetR/AcrR family transcriptional regulator [Enterococcus alishanensis]